MFKLTKPTRTELNWMNLRWQLLRRNESYRAEFKFIFKQRFVDPALSDRFCQKWKLRDFAIDPSIEFEDIPGIHKPLIVNNFREHLLHNTDAAAFVNPLEWISEGKFLQVFIDYGFSRNQVEAELAKILAEWLPKWKRFFGGRRHKEPAGPSFTATGGDAKHIRCRINLEAPRAAILKEMASILKEITGGDRYIRWPPHTGRLHLKTWKTALTAYDLSKRNDLKQIARILNMEGRPSTVLKMIQRVSAAILAIEPEGCDGCLVHNCKTNGNPCTKIKNELEEVSPNLRESIASPQLLRAYGSTRDGTTIRWSGKWRQIRCH